jgi:hypothetical protein
MRWIIATERKRVNGAGFSFFPECRSLLTISRASPFSLAQVIRSDLAKYEKLVKAANIQPQ